MTVLPILPSPLENRSNADLQRSRAKILGLDPYLTNLVGSVMVALSAEAAAVAGEQR